MTEFVHRFVETMPEVLEEGVLYISLPYGTVLHRCGCGCGREVVTPLSPTDWKLIFDGETISLYPSIGNWDYPCRSHYWIRNNRVVWAEDWSDSRVEAATEHDRQRKHAYYGESTYEPAPPTPIQKKPRTAKFRWRWWLD